MNTSVTPDQSTRTDEPDELPTRPKLQLTATQLVASAGAAVTATVAASYLGIAGTVIGAAVASVLTVTGNAVYSHSLQRTKERVREVVPRVERFAGRTSTLPAKPPPPRVVRTQGRWPVLVAATVGVFVGVLVVVSAVEVVAGRPLSDLVRGRTGSGTTLGDSGATTRTAPTPQVTVTVTPTVVTATPTVTVTGTPTTVTSSPTSATGSATAGTSASASASPTTSPSASPSASQTSAPR